MNGKYPSNISRQQFEIIRPILESARKKTKPRKVDLYDVFNALLYLLKSGCQWRMLPADFPKWKTVYFYFSIWRKRLLDPLDKEKELPSLPRGSLKKNQLARSAKIMVGTRRRVFASPVHKV